MDALAARALNILTGAILMGGAAAWALVAYAFVTSPRWLAAFERRTKAFENFAIAVGEEQRAQSRTLESARAGLVEGEARLSQRISDVGERVIHALHATGLERVERAVESIRPRRDRGSSGGAGG
jgi:uncharacterized membrane protein YccC